jgi:5-formyltetrahydrofolate cyclo-ligase
MTSFGFLEIIVILVFALVALDIKHIVRGVRWVQGFKKQINKLQGDFRSQMNELVYQQESVDLLESLPDTSEAMREWGNQQYFNMPKQLVHQASSQIVETLQNFDPYLKASSVGAFCSSIDEIDTHGILQQILRDSKTLCLPYCEAGQMHFVPVQDLKQDLAPGTFGIMEPVESLRKTYLEKEPHISTPTVPDILLIPGRAFDEHGGRIGRGKGFYDKYLAHIPPSSSVARVGITLDVQIAQKKLKLEPHDQTMHYLISEKRILHFEDVSEKG